MSGFNLADLFEHVVDAAGDREAVVSPNRRMTYRQLDERASRLANHLTQAGIGPGDHVGLQLSRGAEYLEGMLAAFKIRAVPININYQYVETELHCLYGDADLVALVYERQFGPRAVGASERLELLRHFIVVEDGSDQPAVPGSVPYEQVLAGSATHRPPGGQRSGDDRYIAYTGGTTGLPKGVVWRHEDIFFAAMGGGDTLLTGQVLTDPAEIATRLLDPGAVYLMTPPLMHVSAQWGAFQAMFAGGKIVFAPPGSFDADAILRLVEQEKVNILTIVGDAMARPILDTIQAATTQGASYELSSLFVIGSGGAILSASTKDRLAEVLPSVILVDGLGASETGVVGSRSTTASSGPGQGPRFTVDADTAVLDEAGAPVMPGSGHIGRLARRGHVPLGYHKDETKTAAAFVTVDGDRWVLPGDMATLETDGTVVLLGRGSLSINTGGEKVYPEEVEGVLKGHPDVIDTVVVGLPDERFGDRVVAVVKARPGCEPTVAALREFARPYLAGYKLPRQVVLVDAIARTPAGKPDYPLARQAAANWTAV